MGGHSGVQEVQSAWKTYVPRSQLEKALDYARRKKIPHVVFWDIDRFWRNRQRAVEDIRSYSQAGIEIHFVRQAFFEDMQKAPHPWNEILFEMVLNVLAWIAEEESIKRSERVKKAYKYGNHPNWGRPGVPYTDEEILRVYEEEGSMRKASKRLPYRTKSGKKRFVSVSYISEAVKRGKQ